MRSRLLDLAIATVCVACVAAPLLPVTFAASAVGGTVLESSGVVDQKVAQTGVISKPLNGRFGSGTSGTVDGQVQWEVYSSAASGIKLLLSTDRDPAMRDATSGVDIPDTSSTAAPWSVGSGARAFGFTAFGGVASISRFDGGQAWRGFEGTRSVEVGRRTAPLGRSRTTVRLRAEFGAPLASNARPTATIRATEVVNL